MASQGLVNRDSQFETLLGMKHDVNEYKKSSTKNANNNFSDVIYLIKVINNGIQTKQILRFGSLGSGIWDKIMKLTFKRVV